jgi:hypothetical protein
MLLDGVPQLDPALAALHGGQTGTLRKIILRQAAGHGLLAAARACPALTEAPATL